MNANPAQTFLVEAEDLLVNIEETALEITPGKDQPDLVHQLFRAFHTLKGSGAMFGFEEVAAFTHHVETALDRVRDGALALSYELIQLILQSKDHIKILIDAAQGGPAAQPGNATAIIDSLARLMENRSAGAEIQPPIDTAPSQPTPPSPPPPSSLVTSPASSAETRTDHADRAALRSYHIRFRPNPGLMVGGTNPVGLLDELRAMGPCQVVADTSAIPTLDQLQPDQCALAWDISLVTDQPLSAIRDVFIFVEDGSEISIQPEPGAPESTQAAAPTLGGSATSAFLPASSNDIDSPRSAEPPGDSHAGADPQRVQGPARTATASTRTNTSKGTGAHAHADAATSTCKVAQRESTVRVPSDRLDRLVNLVGELVMNQSRLSQIVGADTTSRLSGPVEELERLVGELRDNVLGIRMMPIGATFSRFKRLVHDLSAELGKEIDLVTEGAETELDKTVIDQLGDPLVHLIRNSIDHGIESPEERAARGKPRRGTVRLAAAHVGSSVILTITDDGRGIDADAVRAKAVERGLIAAEATLSEKEILDLIFRPGFSTARQVTNVSGRGVGMDAAKRQFDALRAQVRVTSSPGLGTTLTITLPLTLAIIDGLLVEIDRDQFIVPMSLVTENVELHRHERGRNNGRPLIAVRGELVPYIPLREAFGFPGTSPDIEKIVIVRHGDERLGLVVDRVLGSHQTVIQSLGRFYRHIRLVSGATIMGDGRVALILDVAGMIRQAEFLRQSAPSLRLPPLAAPAVSQLAAAIPSITP